MHCASERQRSIEQTMTEEEFNVALDAVRNGKGPQDKNWWFVYGAISRVHDAFDRGPGSIPKPVWTEEFIDRLDKEGRRILKKAAEGRCGRFELYQWLMTRTYLKIADCCRSDINVE
jgi:hypothetical protein